MEPILELLSKFGPFLILVVVTSLILLAANRLARRSQQGTAGALYQLLNWVTVSLAVLAGVVALPLNSETQGQILSLLGLVLTAVIALSSTTFVANAMAGIMLHATQPFRPGDYVQVNKEFGRVTKRSLIHTQIQTEWRDITTLPNMLLVNNPVTVMHRDGTIISAEVSIGYDVAYTRVQELLIQAGTEAALTEPYVLVQELLDHAVLYRICGFLPEMKHPLSARSNLRKKVLEQLHGHGIEIVSPAFMNQRALDPERPVIPEQPVMTSPQSKATQDTAPEEKIFDKAEQAASVEELKQQLEAAQQAVKDHKAQLKTAGDEQREALEKSIEVLELQAKRLAERVEKITRKD
ncbi:mechanosensitive ion channel [Parahaliea sp. F7430]|uniref:Small-conductance mechanosensitive channel n=1 Tax=Sediminihaliea albiluteola TaxID=2758564 RepID=A0A7W2TWZ9_9GAMM|nr:mechanosensitive ion channel domain-containing protein [Sediminihaliea albiluteola]MBA6413502.1 mechanosensitive ion channel [Sediminihaliea albiluteola]